MHRFALHFGADQSGCRYAGLRELLRHAGIRNRSSLAGVAATINGISVPVLYAGPAPNYPGLDQVNVGLVLSLRGAGESNVVLAVDGQASNIVTINVQ